MSGRPKRRATAPKKFSIEEGMSQSAIKPVPRCSCGVSGYTLPDSPVRGQQQRVLRYLNVDDLNRTLQDLTVYVLWPEDGLWYEAIIHKSDGQDQSATLFYTDTAEEEVVNLEELITDRHLAFLELRAAGVELKEDEFLADDLIHSVPSPSPSSEASGSEGESSAPEGSSPSQDPEASGRKGGLSPFVPGQPSHHDSGQMLISGMHSEGAYGYDSLNLQGSGLLSHPTPQSEGRSGDRFGATLNGNPLKTLRTSGSLTRQSSSNSRELPPLRLDIMTKLREKTIEQLQAVLKLAKSEQRKADKNESNTPTNDDDSKLNDTCPTDDLAKAIEVEILKLCGGENTEYKNKFRTLYFNLKDARNPELRCRVLSGDLTPEHLVSMTPRELASQELSQWRQRKKEELLQATVLDQDAAAKFSTAAALKTIRGREDHVELSPVGQTQRSQALNVPLVEAPVEMETVQEVISIRTTAPVMERLEETTKDVEGNEASMDIEEIPDWAMEVVEAPTPSAPTPHLYSPKATEERNQSTFGPVPIRATPPDLTPLLMKDDGTLIVGESVWQGEIGFAEQTPFKAQCISIAGKCNLRTVLISPQIMVQGRMNLKKVEDFLEKLRTSKSRSATIAILRPPTDATDDDIAAIQENVHYYLSRERTGAMTLGEGVEGYLIAKCSLTGRLLSAAQMLMEDTEKIPNDIDVNEFLLVAVHKKDWKFPKPASSSSAAPSSIHVSESSVADVSDPRIRAGIKPVVQRDAFETTPRSLPMGLTLESISNLAAMLGVQKSQTAPSEPSPQASMLPHQMTVPTASVTAAVPVMDVQSNVVIQPERPKFLVFDPVSNKALPVNPGAIQYDPTSNRVMVVGPLPQGFVIQQLANQQAADTSAEGYLTNAQALSLMAKSSQSDVMAEMQQSEEMRFAGMSKSYVQPSVSSVSQRLTNALVQPMVPGRSNRGRGGFRPGRVGRGGFGRATTSALQGFPESNDP